MRPTRRRTKNASLDVATHFPPITRGESTFLPIVLPCRRKYSNVSQVYYITIIENVKWQKCFFFSPRQKPLARNQRAKRRAIPRAFALRRKTLAPALVKEIILCVLFFNFGTKRQSTVTILSSRFLPFGQYTPPCSLRASSTDRLYSL